ncbi:MAG: hypothetical protein JW881_06520 [Spirochaetales bacterium]|nr:hypothetical protein [Spirochaetales bacterium]
MSILKWTFTCIAGIILFLCLIVTVVLVAVSGTVLNADFVIGALGSIDVSDMIENAIQQAGSGEIPDELKEMLARIDGAIPRDIQRAFEEKTKALVKNSLGTPIRAFYDYILGKTQNLDVVVPLKNVKSEIRVLVYDYLDVLISSQPPEFRQIAKKKVDMWWDRYASQMPQAIDIGAVIMNGDGEVYLETVRRYLRYIQPALTVSVIAAVIIIILIILLHRKPGLSLRIPGIVILSAGLFFLPINTITSDFLMKEFFSERIPEYLLSALVLIISKILLRVQIESIIAICVGSVLIGVSFFLKPKADEQRRRQTAPENG